MQISQQVSRLFRSPLIAVTHGVLTIAVLASTAACASSPDGASSFEQEELVDDELPDDPSIVCDDAPDDAPDVPEAPEVPAPVDTPSSDPVVVCEPVADATNLHRIAMLACEEANACEQAKQAAIVTIDQEIADARTKVAAALREYNKQVCIERKDKNASLYLGAELSLAQAEAALAKLEAAKRKLQAELVLCKQPQDATALCDVAKAETDTARAAEKLAERTLDIAKRDYARMAKLVQDKTFPATDLPPKQKAVDDAQTAYNAAKAEHTAAKARQTVACGN